MSLTKLLFMMLTFLPQNPRAALPPLPEIVISSYGEETRSQISKAVDEARLRPRDAAANGRLAMILHAYEEYEAAEVCYRRVRQLDPEMRWVYLQGLIETQLKEYKLD